MNITAIESLRQQIDGEVRTDRLAQLLFSSDASLYEIVPTGVVAPRHEQDCQRLVKWACENQIPLTMRGGGTSLAGQAVGGGLIVDMARHMRDILEVDVQRGLARVQPGVIIDELNRAVASHGLMFAPDPSTLNRCNIGGAIGNNAWGAHAQFHGTTRDHVESVTMVVGEGEMVKLGPLSDSGLRATRDALDAPGWLHRAVVNQITDHRDEILRRYPSPAVPCNAGYSLQVLARGQPWNPQGSPFNLATLICGAEGTLGVVTEACVKLVPRPRHRALVAGHFSSLEQALEAIVPAVRSGAAAVELLDAFVLGLVANNLEARKHADWIAGEPQAILIAEYIGDDAAESRTRAQEIERLWTMQHGAYHCVRLEQDATEKVWAIRRAGLGLLMGITSPAKPVTFIEDSAVSVDRLPDFVARVREIMERRGLDCVYYGSVGMGLIHLRPLVDLSAPGASDVIAETADEVTDLLCAFGGTASAKHGDGRARGQFLRKFLGNSVCDVMAGVKQAFDPKNVFNPGIIVEPPSLKEHWRARAAPADAATVSTFYRWDGPGGAVAAAQRCLGAGVCRRRDGPGTMCPSYRATLEELHSTRGRGNVLRQVMASDGFAAAMAHPLVHEALSLCLACKGCRAECPANVDMARLKSEHLAHYYAKAGTPLQARLLSSVDTLNRLGRIAPGLARLVLNTSWAKRVTGVHPRRSLPVPKKQTLSAWFKSRKSATTAPHGELWLLNDTFTEFYDVDVGRAAVTFFERCGYRVMLAPHFASLRIALSLGMIDQARKRMNSAVNWLMRQKPALVVGLEPSETLTFRDEAAALFREEADARAAADYFHRIVLFDEAVVALNQRGHVPALALREAGVTLRLHGHCHQKALTDMSAATEALGTIADGQVRVIASGCCGMAGFFGYDVNSYDVSMRIGEQVLFPAVRSAPDSDVIVAAGTSCRQQILHGTGRVALHPAQVLASAL